MVLMILFGLFHCLTHVLACMSASLVFSSAECLSVSRRRAFVTVYSFTNELIGIWGFVECKYNPLLGNAGERPSHLLRNLLIFCSNFSAVLVGVAK